MTKPPPWVAGTSPDKSPRRRIFAKGRGDIEVFLARVIQCDHEVELPIEQHPCMEIIRRV